MSNLDTLYRAFNDFRKTTSDDHDCALQRNIVARADSNNDFVETVRYTCHIDEDWVEAIESGMVHVEKAIAEERQFIRNNGEVVPIEKVRRVSRDSVEHLAKHSDLITKEPPEGEPVIPDQLYTVERLSDYAVYENRFLYMLLKYLEQFISLRYNKIVELANTYRGKLRIDKNIKTGGQNVKFKVELNEERRNDPLLSELNPNKSLIERIGTLYKMVTHYLSVPLMLEVSKSPMIHPPITVTNVLRMNHNFRGAMKLYEFVSSYDKPGYSAEKKVKKITPFPDIPADEYAEVEALASYLTYQYGMGVKDVLREQFLNEEDRRKKEAEKKHKEKLAALKRRIEESGESPEEYMLMLEARNRALEADSLHLVAARAEIEKQKEEINRLDSEVARLTMLAEDRAAEITSLNQKYEQDMAAAQAEHEQALADKQAEHEEEINVLKQIHQDEMNEQEQDFLDKIEIIEKQHEEQIKDIEAPFRAEITAKNAIIRQKDEDMAKLRSDCEEQTASVRSECAKKIAEQQKIVDEKEKKFNDVVAENKLLIELKTLSDARLTAVKFKHGYMTPADDYTSELAFNEIERQYNIFSDFFKRTWRKTKKKIRQDLADKILGTKKSAENAKQTANPDSDGKDAAPAPSDETAKDATGAKEQPTVDKQAPADADLQSAAAPTEQAHDTAPEPLPIDFLPEQQFINFKQKQSEDQTDPHSSDTAGESQGDDAQEPEKNQTEQVEKDEQL